MYPHKDFTSFFFSFLFFFFFFKWRAEVAGSIHSFLSRGVLFECHLRRSGLEQRKHTRCHHCCKRDCSRILGLGHITPGSRCGNQLYSSFASVWSAWQLGLSQHSMDIPNRPKCMSFLSSSNFLPFLSQSVILLSGSIHSLRNRGNNPRNLRSQLPFDCRRQLQFWVFVRRYTPYRNQKYYRYSGFDIFPFSPSTLFLISRLTFVFRPYFTWRKLFWDYSHSSCGWYSKPIARLHFWFLWQ